MKISLFLLIAVIFSVVATAQQKDSCTCIPNPLLREAARVNEKYKTLKAEDSLNRSSIQILNQQVKNRESVIETKDAIINNSRIVINNLRDELMGANMKFTGCQAYTHTIEKALKNERTKTRVAGVTVVVLAVLSGVLIISK